MCHGDNMKNTRGWKNYAIFYGFALIFYFIYISVLALQNDGYDPGLLIGTIYLPVIFVGLMFVFDTIFDTILSRGKRKEKSDFDAFARSCTLEIQKQCDFSLEDFRRLRQNSRFQKALQQAYRIKTEGETDELNMVVLEKKFKKNTREAIALEIVIKQLGKSI